MALKKKKRKAALSVEQIALRERKRIRKEKQRIKSLLAQETDLALRDTNSVDLMDKFALNSKQYRKSILRAALKVLGIINGAQQANSVLNHKLNMGHAQIGEGLIMMLGDYIIKVKAFEGMLKQSQLPESVQELMLERFVQKVMPIEKKDKQRSLTKIKLDQLTQEMKAGNAAIEQQRRKGENNGRRPNVPDR